MRPWRRVALLLTVVAVAAGCGNPSGGVTEELRRAIDRVADQPRGFVYSVEADGVTTQVEGFFEDDYRYKVRVLRDGELVLDQVVSDDAVALRFADPAAVDDVVSFPPGSPAEPLLRSRRWVVDPQGAPADWAVVAEDQSADQGPVLDALQALEHLRSAAAAGVARFNEQALDYRPREDPFPKPEEGADVVRYDIRRPPIPARDVSRGGDRALPGEQHFRKMAVYVKDGAVLHVLEVVEIDTRLEEVIEKYEMRPPRGLSGAALREWVVDELNRRLAQRGLPPIRLRSVSLDVLDVGQAKAVALPADAATAPVLLKQGPSPADAAAEGAKGVAPTASTASTASDGTGSPPGA